MFLNINIYLHLCNRVLLYAYLASNYHSLILPLLPTPPAGTHISRRSRTFARVFGLSGAYQPYSQETWVFRRLRNRDILYQLSGWRSIVLWRRSARGWAVSWLKIDMLVEETRINLEEMLAEGPLMVTVNESRLVELIIICWFQRTVSGVI
jgi:hypothetical protein